MNDNKMSHSQDEVSQLSEYLSLVYNSASSPIVWFFAAAIFSILNYYLERYRQKAITRENSMNDEQILPEHGKSVSLCTSPNCVRCNQHHDILRRAQERIAFYFVPDDDQGIREDVSDLYNDLKISLLRCNAKSEDPDEEPDRQLDDITTVTNPTVFFMNRLNENEFFFQEDFPGLDNVVNKCVQIHLEFSHLYQSPLEETKSLWKTNTTGCGKWEVSHLINQGKITRAGELCPLTMSVLEKVPSLMDGNLFGNVAFSVVHPQTEIETHCGSTNLRIRCHLGLQVPTEECKLQVGDREVRWTEGGVVCFQDAFPHSVRHYGDSGMRVVLMLDLWHPGVSVGQREILDYAFWPFD